MLQKQLAVLFLPCLALIGCCCLCGGLVLLAGGGVLESAGEFLSTPFRWFQQDEATPDLNRILEEGTSAEFRIGEPCEFLSVEGSTIQSKADPGEQFARPLTRQEVIDIALVSLHQDLYQVMDKNIALISLTPVRYQMVPGEGVFLAFDEPAHTESSVTSRSLNGVVHGSLMNGSLHLSEDRSSVEGGQGVEASSSIDVTFNCHLLWENIE